MKKSLLRMVVEAYHERMMERRAIRLLSKQAWSVEFLSWLLVRSAKKDSGASLEIIDKDGRRLVMTYGQAEGNVEASNIFDRLDDDLAVEDFIREHSKR